MKADLFISIDFDGTVTKTDITDAVIQRFAGTGWEEPERLWEEGVIGSKECLEAQMSLIPAPLEEVLGFVDSFAIDENFPDFIYLLKTNRIPFCIISDGFKVFIDRLLKNAGLKDIPVYANRLTEEDGHIKTLFPYSNKDCSSGVCKCAVANTLRGSDPIIHIGDGRSDFCIAEEALFVFSKGKLTDFCKSKDIPHIEFNDFKEIRVNFAHLLNRISEPDRRLFAPLPLNNEG